MDIKAQEENNRLFCEACHKLLHLKNISPAFGDIQFSDTIKDCTNILSKYLKTEDKLKILKDVDDLLDPVFLENQIEFPLEPYVLATHPLKGELISSHLSTDSLIDRSIKIANGYVVSKEFRCTLTHSLTEWRNSWVKVKKVN